MLPAVASFWLFFDRLSLFQGVTRPENFLPLAFALLFCIFTLISIDIYLRWHRTEETVSLQHEMLVVGCSRCLFRRRKEIPLSTIVRIEEDNGRSGWSWMPRPETLCVVYSNSTTYRFGLCMTKTDRIALAEKIMEQAHRYV